MQIRKILYCMILLVLMGIPPATAAALEKQTINIAISNEEPLLKERILSVAFERLGYQVMINNFYMKTAVISVNDGENDVLATQVKNLEANYKNLIRVPYPISSVDFIVYTKSDFKKKIQSWKDLANLKVCYNAQNLYVAEHIPDSAAKQIKYNTPDEVFMSLRSGVADVAVMPLVEIQEQSIREGIVEYAKIGTEKTYSYINKKNKRLVNFLAEEYRNMDRDGTLKAIKENRYPPSDDEKTVLHISSYSTDMKWERDIVAGVKQPLEEAGNVLYYNYALNLKRSTGTTAQYKLMNDQIRQTFLKRSPDVVIISDNDALNYLQSEYGNLFSGIPVVFCGINNFSASMISDFDNITGVVENTSAVDTVEEILTLYPETKNIYVVNDHSTGGISWRNSLEQDLKPFCDRLNIVYNNDLPLLSMASQIKGYGEDTIILYGTFYRDCDGKYYSEGQIISFLDRINSKPVFALKSVNMGMGALGGKLVDSTKQGLQTGKLAVQILNGKPASEIPIVDDSEFLNSWMFDYDVAKKYHIDTDLFTMDHVALNKKLSFFETNPAIAAIIIIASITAVIIIIILIVFLQLQRNAKRRTEYMALHDELTGLENRVFFKQKLEELLTSGASGGVLLLDLDCFKEINNVYGHTTGDLCLIEVANRIREISSLYDTFVRTGGDEFYLISLKDEKSCKRMAEEIRTSLLSHIEVSGHSFHITASMGLVMFPEYGNDVTSIMQNADLALYKAKSSGKNQSAIYDPELSKTANHQESILQVLRFAIPEKEVFLLYQPIINVTDGTCYSFETLMRIQSKTLGLLSPDEFIPLAESSELIVPLGLWALETACTFAKKLKKDGKSFSHVSVNVSNIQLQRARFVSEVTHIVKKVDIDPHLLQLEITESAFINHSNANIQKLLALQDLGITIAMDDFGTGYSSMKSLVNLPIDTLKIDKAFIDEMESDEKKRVIAKLIIDTAHSLHMNVVAEGVEQKVQKDSLTSMGCDLTQGYYYSKPLDANTLEMFLG